MNQFNLIVIYSRDNTMCLANNKIKKESISYQNIFGFKWQLNWVTLALNNYNRIFNISWHNISLTASMQYNITKINITCKYSIHNS